EIPLLGISSQKEAKISRSRAPQLAIDRGFERLELGHAVGRAEQGVLRTEVQRVDERIGQSTQTKVAVDVLGLELRVVAEQAAMARLIALVGAFLEVAPGLLHEVWKH